MGRGAGQGRVERRIYAPPRGRRELPDVPAASGRARPGGIQKLMNVSPGFDVDPRDGSGLAVLSASGSNPPEASTHLLPAGSELRGLAASGGGGGVEDDEAVAPGGGDSYAPWRCKASGRWAGCSRRVQGGVSGSREPCRQAERAATGGSGGGRDRSGYRRERSERRFERRARPGGAARIVRTKRRELVYLARRRNGEGRVTRVKK